MLIPQNALARRCVAVISAGLLLAACERPVEDTGAADKARAAEYLRTFLIERDWQRWPEYFVPGAKINGSDLALQIMRGSADGLNFSFSGLTLTITDQLAEPGHVATTFVLEGLNVQPFDAQPATNTRLRIDGFALDRLEGGKVVESRLFLDVFGLRQRARAAAAGR